MVLLGTGTPNAEPHRAGPAVALITEATGVLVDLGAGVLRQLVAAAERGLDVLAPARVHHALVTHLHSDHTFGLAELLVGGWVLGRAPALQVAGPPGLQPMVDHLLQAHAADLRERGDGLQPVVVPRPLVEVREVCEGAWPLTESIRVVAFPVRHGTWQHALGYRLTTADRTVVISGDLVAGEELLPYYQGADVLVHEVYCEEGLRRCPPPWQRYHRQAHTSARMLGALAARARPGLLVLTHMLQWGASQAQLLEELRESYDGPVVLGEDTMVI